MSKSDPSDQSRINLKDDSSLIKKKIQKAKTDSDPFPNNVENLSERPEIKNLINIYSAITKKSEEQVIKNYFEKDFKTFKNDLSEIVDNEVSEISKEMKHLLDDTKYLDSIIKDGSERAQEIAEKNIKELKKIIGFFGT